MQHPFLTTHYTGVGWMFTSCRWSGRPGVEAVLKAGQAAMGEHGAAYRIGTVMEVFGVVRRMVQSAECVL